MQDLTGHARMHVRWVRFDFDSHGVVVVVVVVVDVVVFVVVYTG